MIQVKRTILGRPVASKIVGILTPRDINVGYGNGQLRPNGSRDRAEERQMALKIMRLTGMSGQMI